MSTTIPVKTLTSLKSRNWLSDSPSKKNEEVQWSNNQQSRGFRVIFWTYLRKYLCCDSVGLMITNYLMNGSFSSFLEAESDNQFWDIEDVNVFTGLVVEIRHIASWHQKRHRKNSFLCSIQWCNPHLATMLRSGDI